MRRCTADFPATTDCCAWRDGFGAFLEAVIRADVVPDSVEPKERAIRLNKCRWRTVERQAIERAGFDNACPIYKSGYGLETRIDRSQSVVKSPGAARSVPISLQNRSRGLSAYTVGPGASSLKLCPVTLVVIEPIVGSSDARVSGAVFARREHSAECVG